MIIFLIYQIYPKYLRSDTESFYGTFPVHFTT